MNLLNLWLRWLRHVLVATLQILPAPNSISWPDFHLISRSLMPLLHIVLSTGMCSISWEGSGKGPIDLSLSDAHELAIQAGFVFNTDTAQPPSKRANLQSIKSTSINSTRILSLHILLHLAYHAHLFLQKCLNSSMSIPSRPSNKNSSATNSTLKKNHPNSP